MTWRRRSRACRKRCSNCYGEPRTPAELDGHRMIGFISSATKAPMPFVSSTPQGLTTVTLTVAVSVSSADTSACLAVHGSGMIQVPRYRVEQELASGQLVEVLRDFAPLPIPVYMLYPEKRHRTPRARVFMAWTEAEFHRQLGLRATG